MIENVKDDFNDDFDKDTGKVAYKDQKYNMKQLLTKLNKMSNDFKFKNPKINS